MKSKNFLNPGLLGIAFSAIALSVYGLSAYGEYDFPAPDLLDIYPSNIITHDDVQCLAENIYFEARSESLAGQLAVAFVTLNRVRDVRYPSTICDVVYQGPTYTNWKGNELPVRHKCQFSWYCDGLSDEPKDSQSMDEAYSIALEVLSGNSLDFTHNATHYHSIKVNPHWAKHMDKTVRIDDHIFYRRK